MRDDDDRQARARSEMLRQPGHHLDVQMVGRLIQQEEIQVSHEGAGELHTPTLTAGHRAQTSIQQRLVKAAEQPVKDLADRRVTRPLVHVLTGYDVLRHRDVRVEGFRL